MKLTSFGLLDLNDLSTGPSDTLGCLCPSVFHKPMKYCPPLVTMDDLDV